MRKTSIVLLVPALAAFLSSCGRNETARNNEQPGTEQQQPAPEQNRQGAAPEQSRERRQTAANGERTREATPRERRQPAAAEERAAERPARNENVQIPSGAVLRVRLDQTLDTDENQPGDKFDATLIEPVVVDGRTVIPKGTRFQGSITTAETSGRLSGKGVLTVKLDSFELNGKRYDITSTAASRITGGHTKRDIGIIGGSAAAGAAIGAITGGGKGAAIGAGAGAAAGTGAAAATGKQDVRLPAETVMVFTLQRPVDLG